MVEVLVYSRTGCHLCEAAIEIIKEIRTVHHFSLDIELIDNNQNLESQYGEQVPVIIINGRVHDYWRVDRERFTSAVVSAN